MSQITSLITARGGSKGIPGKNVIDVAGKPLIAWSIEAALASEKVARVLVSTDDREIAGVARQWGAETPFVRPTELAQADTPHIDVVVHALDWLRETAGSEPKYLLLLQPTSPLRTTADIDEAIAIAERERADSVVSVCPASDHPYLLKQIDAAGKLENFIESDIAYLRRQDLPPVYVLNGAIYLTRASVLREQRTFQPEQTYAYVMPAERSYDIDEWHDLHLVRFLMEEKSWPERESPSPAGRSVPATRALSLRKPA